VQKKSKKETYDDEKTSQKNENKLSLKSKYYKEKLLKNVRIENNKDLPALIDAYRL